MGKFAGINIPSLTAISNLLSDGLTHHALGHCQLMTKSMICPNTVITTDGGCITAFEVIGMNRFLTEFTEKNYLNDLAIDLRAVLRPAHHKVGLTYIRDRGRNKETLDDIFHSTLNSIGTLGFEAAHFFEKQKEDLNKNCSYERTIMYVKTEPTVSNRDSVNNPKFLGENFVLGDAPKLMQNNFIESLNIVQAHNAFCQSVKMAISDSISVDILSADRYLQIIKEEEELISLEQTGWRAKSIGDDCDFTLSDNDDDFVTYPPLAYQLVTNNKKKSDQDSTLVESNSMLFASIDRDTFSIDALPFSKLLARMSPHIPLRCTFEFECGTENIAARLSSRKTWMPFLMFSKQSKNINNALTELINYVEKDSGTLLGGTMAITTWGSTIEQTKAYKKEITQALGAWGSPTVQSATDEFQAYSASLPAFSRTQSARVCVQPIEKHIKTSPLTRPTSPMKSGGLCMSSLDGRLFPIDPTSPEQHYSLNAIVGGMGSGKTVFSAVFNNTFLFGKGNTELPLMSYLDFGSGVCNYLSSVRSWLPDDQQYKIELLNFHNTKGSMINILEPQFGLDQLEDQELSFASAFICRIVNGTSKESVHAKLSAVVDDILRELFKESRSMPKLYTSRIANPVNNERRLQAEINELLESAEIDIPDTKRKTWFLIRDKLFKLGRQYFKHARFCHRQGSPTLEMIPDICNKSTAIKTTYEVYKTNSNDPLVQYIRTSIQTLMNRYPFIFKGASQIDISQARIIGVNLKGVAGTGSDPETVNTKRMFGMLGKYIAEKNFWREPEDFMKLVPDDYKEMYYKILETDFRDKKHSFSDEYKQMKSDEMDAILDNSALIARKYNMCITVSSQSPQHLPPEMLRLCSNLYVLELEQKSADYLAKAYKLSDSFISNAQRLVGSSDSFGRNILYIGRFKKIKGCVVQILRNYITPSYLWNFSSDAVDEVIKSQAKIRFGERDAYLRLGKRFPRGSALDDLNKRLKDSKFEARPLTNEDVILEFIDSLATVEI
ncbi:hypothetical protein [Vibrio sp. R78045]|uniref:hypothetical protein n=1 Tax=Vibrio sp. R78045 TaxID=3093868 RepID=UPI0036F4226E